MAEGEQFIWREARQPASLYASLKAVQVKDWLPRLAGLQSAIRAYRQDWRENLAGDLSAGIVVAVMLIPQSLAYAILAGMPPITGFFAAILALFSYPVFGEL